MNLLSFARWFSLLDGQTISILLLDAEGNISARNNSNLGSEHRNLTLHWRDLNVGDALQNKKFEKLVSASLNFSVDNTHPFPPPVTVMLSDGRRVCIDVLPLPDDYKPSFDYAHALLNFRELEAPVAISPDSLREHFGLTPSEASLAKALTDGESLKEASSRLDISIWTARSHLRSIFQKTDTHRQAELVSLITHIDN